MGDLYCDLSSLVLLAVLVFYPSFGRVNSRLGNQRYAWFGSSWERVSFPTRECLIDGYLFDQVVLDFGIDGILIKARLVWFWQLWCLDSY